MLKKIFKNLLFFILVFLCANICYATSVKVTDENLAEALKKFNTSKANENKYSISVSDNVINVAVDNENYVLKYDLKNKPTFTFEVPIEKGMSYEEYERQTKNLILPMLGYIAVTNVQGVEIEDSFSYFTLSYLGAAFNGSPIFGSYIIIDDINNPDGFTIDSSNSKVIYTSEFGERVIELVNDTYPETNTFSDSEGINSYTFLVERKESTDTSCKLVATLSVNTDADFSKIIGFGKEMSDAFLGKEITKENADFVITLKKGQKCKLKTTKEVKGHRTSGGSIEIERDEITAIKKGDTKVIFTIGDEEKTFYIIVEENIDNSSLETIILDLDEVKEEPKEEPKEEQNNITSKDNTVASSKLPEAGIKGFILLIIIGFIISILIGIKLKKYNEI